MKTNTQLLFFFSIKQCCATPICKTRRGMYQNMQKAQHAVGHINFVGAAIVMHQNKMHSCDATKLGTNSV